MATPKPYRAHRDHAAYSSLYGAQSKAGDNFSMHHCAWILCVLELTWHTVRSRATRFAQSERSRSASVLCWMDSVRSAGRSPSA